MIFKFILLLAAIAIIATFAMRMKVYLQMRKWRKARQRELAKWGNLEREKLQAYSKKDVDLTMSMYNSYKNGTR